MIYEQNTDYYPTHIFFSPNLIFFIHWWDKKIGKDKETLLKKGCVEKAKIFDFYLEETELVAFISCLESFIKNQFFKNRVLEINNFEAKIVFTKDKEPFLNIKQLNENEEIIQKNFSKVDANYILKCYQIATREYNLCFASSSPTRVTVSKY